MSKCFPWLHPCCSTDLGYVTANGSETGIKHLKCTAVTEMLITTVSIFGEDIVRNRHLCFVCITHLQSTVLLIYSHFLWSNTGWIIKKKIMCEWNIMCFIPFSEDSNEKVQGLLCYIHIGILYRWTTLIGSEADIMEFEIYEGEARTVSPISVAPWVKAPQYSVYS